MKKYQYLTKATSVQQYKERDKTMILLIIEISAQLHRRREIISMAIRGGIRDGRPKDTIIKTCADNIRDNESVMCEILGHALVAKIKSFHQLNFTANEQ